MEQFELTNIGYLERFLEALERNYFPLFSYAV